MELKTILLTRASQHASTLLAALRDLGVKVYCDPLFSMQPLLSIQDRYTLLTQGGDIAIFISRNAVDVVLPIIGNAAPWRWVALGPGTAQQLRNYGVDQILYTSNAPSNAKTLLQYLVSQINLQNLCVMIFCGEDYDPWLEQQLQLLGAKVNVRAAYRRVLLQTWNGDYDLDAAIITCVTSLFGLRQIVPDLDLPLIVVSDRILQVALEMGYTAVYNSHGITDQNIISALAKVNKCMTR